MNSKTRYPLWSALVFYWLLTFALYSLALVQTQGHWGYPLDDTYIHMAMGKHLVTDGFWGVSQYGFSSSTSSPLWTFLIAVAYRLMGPNDWSPLVLSLICGSGIIFSIYQLFKATVQPLRLLIFLLLGIIFIPLPVLTLTGMEHLLHGLLSIALIYAAGTFLSTNKNNPRQFALLLGLSALLVMTRYEGLFLIFAVALAFLIARRFRAAFSIAAAGLLPVGAYGVFALTQGSDFLPTSILLKGNTPAFTPQGVGAFFQRFLMNLDYAPHILVLLIACLGIYLWREKQASSRKKDRCLVGIYALMTLLHLLFAGMGRFYRYEAYLLLVGLLIVVDLLSSLFDDRPVKVGNLFNAGLTAILVLLFLTPFVWRTSNALRDYPIAVKNIYEQQYQMGRFLNQYYSGAAVAANDIGAMNYLADIKTLDLYGLGSTQVAQAKRKNLFDVNYVDQIVMDNDVDIVVIYNTWFEGQIPASWVEIGRWQIVNNVIAASDTVSFYAPGASQVPEVTAHLQEFSHQLPSGVIQSGRYTAR